MAATTNQTPKRRHTEHAAERAGQLSQENINHTPNLTAAGLDVWQTQIACGVAWLNFWAPLWREDRRRNG